MRASVGVFVSLAVSLSVGCGGGGSGAATPEASSAADSPEQHCLTVAGAKHTPKPNAPESMTLQHILVHSKDSRSPKGATRTRGEACLRAQEALEALKAGGNFVDLVKKYSDSPGPSNDGNLGSVQRSELERPFGDAAAELEPQQMSDVVETRDGFHVIVRTQ